MITEGSHPGARRAAANPGIYIVKTVIVDPGSRSTRPG
jgi:hypothetical protein